MTKSLTPVQRWADAEPGFNRHAADVVFKRMMAMDDDEALVFGRILAAETLRYDLIKHRDVITKAVGSELAARTSTMRRALAREAVIKTRTGKDPSGELQSMAELDLLSKAFGDDPYARNQHGEFASQESRRFVESHQRIATQPGKPLADAHARQFGIPTPVNLSGDDLSHYQQAYQQIKDLIAPYARYGDRALLHVHVEGKDGKTRTTTDPMPRPGDTLRIKEMLRPGDRIQSASVSVVPHGDAPGAAFDALSALGAPRAGAVTAGMYVGGALDADRVRRFGEEINQPQDGDDALAPPSHRLFRRLGAGSKLLQDSLGDAAPRKLQYALALGNHVGTYGPEAQKVIGPAADRTAYRYRGTERSVDPNIGLRFDAVRRDPQIPAADKREFAVMGRETAEGDWEPGPVLRGFRGMLPDPKLNQLQRKAGRIPPSQGVVVNARGQVATQAVGYGDDWYLPFNLRNLAGLKGGEYIRTRSFGGPTTEDIYTGLMSGARALTVVSHNGVFTVEFDDNLRGGRRFNDKAAGMVSQYGHLLDAIKAGQVTTSGIDPSRMAELEAKAARLADPVEDEKGYSRELEKLKARERANPTLSQAQRDQIGVEYLNTVAERRTTADGHVMNPDEMVAEFANGMAARQYQSHIQAAQRMGVSPSRSLADYQREQMAALGDASPAVAAAKVADAMGLKAQHDAFVRRTEGDYKAGLQPLRLDGQGYQAALEALQEQYPYYVSRVEFHPWTDAVDRTDSGYVKPRHNRPEKALAGYFDESITGKGKATADSTRYQNFPVRRGRLNFVGQRREEGERGAEQAKTREVSPETAGELRRESTRQMLDAVLSQKSFLPGAAFESNGQRAEVGGRSPAADAANPNFPSELKAVFGQDRAALEAKLDDPAQEAALRRDLDRVLAFNDNAAGRLFDIPEEVRRSYRDEGRIEKPRAVPAGAPAMLRELDKEHELPGRAYQASAAPSREAVSEAYADNAGITALAEAGKLPSSVGAGDFQTKASALRKELGQISVALTRDEQLGGSNVEPRQRELARQAQSLLEATQLRRRHDEAVQRAAHVSMPAAPGPVGDTVEEQTHYHLPAPARQPGESAEDYAETLQIWRDTVAAQQRPGGPEPRLLNSDGGTFGDRNGLSYTGD